MEPTRTAAIPLIHKTTVTPVVKTTAMPAQREHDYDQSWNDWLHRGIAAAFEAERDFMRDVHAQVIAEERRLWRKEFSAETRVLSEQIKTLQNEVASLRTQLAEQKAITGLYKELNTHALELDRLGMQVRDFTKHVGPFIERLRRLGFEQ